KNINEKTMICKICRNIFNGDNQRKKIKNYLKRKIEKPQNLNPKNRKIEQRNIEKLKYRKIEKSRN
ncbi:hypothetical protein DD592_27500, partial [Enterobacter cloacae complex sp. 2DZ2F20B]